MAVRPNPAGTDPSESVKLEDKDGALVSAANPLPVADAALAEMFGNLTFTLDVGDVEIGAVEIKDALTGNRAAVDASGRLSVDGSGVTQPVSANSLPLPSGAATAANQATAVSSLGTIASNTTGAATAARQDTGNTALAAIQAAVEGTVDVAVIGSVSVSGTIAATQSGTWSVSFTAPQHVIIDSSAAIGVTGPLTDTQLRATALPVSGTFYQVTQPVSGTFWQTTQPVSIASLPALAAGSAVIGHVIIDSASIANLDVALSTRLKPADTLAGVTTVTAVTSITNPVAVTGPLTDTQLRATPVPVSGTVAVTAAALPLPSGAATDGGLTTIAANQATMYAQQLLQATSAKQDTGNASLAALTLTQGATGTSSTGPLVMALVSDTPQAQADGTLQALSVNNEGRVRVSTAPLEVDFFGAAIPSMTKDASYTASPSWG